MSQVNSKADALDLDHQDQIDLQTSTVFEKKGFFITPSNLNCELIIYWFKAGLGGRGMRMQKRPSLSICKPGNNNAFLCNVFP